MLIEFISNSSKKIIQMILVNIILLINLFYYDAIDLLSFEIKIIIQTLKFTPLLYLYTKIWPDLNTIYNPMSLFDSSLINNYLSHNN